ncbi:MAG TPA: hypothetical protein VFE23_07470 [Usitatibacter sp.]|jgi:hypothetical protein|nr:hypothetical protein [Usitatibacter sp.]
MNTLQRKVTLGAIAIAAALSLNARADQSSWFECERGITDGNTPNCLDALASKPAAAPTAAATVRTDVKEVFGAATPRADESAFYACEREVTDGFTPACTIAGPVGSSPQALDASVE